MGISEDRVLSSLEEAFANAYSGLFLADSNENYEMDMK